MNNTIILTIMNGITYGGLLFMGASGLTLILGLMGVVNMAHGSYYILGAVVGWKIVSALSATLSGIWYFALLIAGLVVGVLSWLVRKYLFCFVKSADGMGVTMLTIGLSMAISDIVLWITNGTAYLIETPSMLTKTVNLGFVQYPGTRLFILGVAAVMAICLWLLMSKTRMGQYIRAGAENRVIAESLGINIKAVFTFVFIMSGFLVGLSGMLGGTYTAFGAGTTDATVLSYSLVIIVLGGMGSLKGAAIGALLVGLVDSFSKMVFLQLTATLIFGIVILVLAFKPQGLFGKEV